MCLAIPGKILEIDTLNGNRTARVQFGGIVKQAYVNFVPDAGVGDYVLVHVGFAISKVDAEEAQRTYALLESLGRMEDEVAANPPLGQ